MPNNPKICPYFLSISMQKITCRGFVPGYKLNQGFSRVGMEKEHYAEYCSNSYHRCQMATIINSVWNQFDIQPCPNNSEVECLHQNECERCGWNPVVAAERLRKWMELHSCDT